MSYILEALKKSEQERGHGNIPDVQTIHSSSLNYRSDKKPYWPYLLTAAVIINTLVFVYFIFDKEKASEAQLTAQQNDVLLNKKPAFDSTPVFDSTSDTSADNRQQPEIISVPSNIKSNDLNKQTVIAIKNPAIKNPAIKNPTVSEKATEENQHTGSKPAATKNFTADKKSSAYSSTVFDYHELPDSTRQQLPAIIISAHVYSSNPSQRSIVINNNFMEEGEYVIDDLILLEITTDGAIFNHNGTLFEYGVVSTWQ